MSKPAEPGAPSPSGRSARLQEKLQADLEKGMRLHSQGKTDSAKKIYDEIVRQDPGNSNALYMCAVVHMEKSEHKQAIDQIERFIGTNRDSPVLAYMLGLSHYEMENRFEALRHLKRALKHDPGHQLARLLLAKLYGDIGRTEKGRECLANGAGFDFVEPEDRITHFDVLRHLELFDEARDILARLLEDRALLPDCLYELTLQPGVHWDASHIRLIEELLSGKNISGKERMRLHFAAARIADREARFHQAIAHFEKANRNPDAAFDIDRYRDTVERLTRIFQEDYFLQRKDQGYQGKRPVFIVGLPRSGKSLIERALARHPEIRGVGELSLNKIFGGKYFIAMDGEMPPEYEKTIRKLGKWGLTEIAAQYLRELDRYDSKTKYLLNSLPHNFQNIGFIKTIFPNAKIIHVTREPADNCLFCFMKNFKNAHDYASDLGVLGAYYRIYHDIMAHWDRVLPGQIHQISYENFVTDPAAELRGLIAYLDLEWDDDALNEPLETSQGTFEPGREAGPINTSYIGYWKNYEPHLAPLLEALGDLAPPSGPST